MAAMRFLKVARALAGLPPMERRAAIDVAKELSASDSTPAPKRTYKRKVKTVAPGVKVVKRKPGRPKKEKVEEPAAEAAE